MTAKLTLMNLMLENWERRQNRLEAMKQGASEMKGNSWHRGQTENVCKFSSIVVILPFWNHGIWNPFPEKYDSE